MAEAAIWRDPISEQQSRYSGGGPAPQHPEDFFARARWWELEAARGYASAPAALLYALTLARAGWARVEDGTIRPFDSERDTTPPRCDHCGGPLEGFWGCGGPVAIRLSKHQRLTRCGRGR